MSDWTPPPLPARWSSTARPAFVGRRTELACLEELWTAVTAGARQVAVVGGEPGAGKSRLVAEFCTTLHRRGASVLLGTAVADFGPPYQPFVEPLEALLAGLGPEHGGLAERLGRLAGRAGAAGPPEADTRRELYDAAVGAVRAAARDRPLVLALEDLHWAGGAALQLLTHLVERTAEDPVLLVATFRSTAPERSTQLVGALAHLYRLDGVRRLEVGGLDTDEIAEYVLGEGGVASHRATGMAHLLRDQTGGNPFLLRELLRDVALRGAGPVPGSHWPAPLSVRDTMAGRLERLTEPQRQTLELAAVVGEDVDVTTMLGASAWSQDTTLAGLDTAVDFGLLEAAGLPGADFRFPHALARQAVLDLMPMTRRTRLHAHVATYLTTAAAPSERRTQRLAYHYAQSKGLGYTPQAVEHLTEAARAAAGRLAHEDAARWFQEAAMLTDEPARRHELLLAAARGHLMAGDFARARALMEDVAEAAEPRMRLAAAIDYESASWRPGLPGHRAVELLTDAVRLVPHDPSDPLYVRALAGLGRALAFTGATRQAGQLGRRAIELARRQDDAELLSVALEASLWHGLHPTDAPDKLARATELSRLAERTGNLGHLGPAAYYRGVISYLQGEPRGLEEAHEDLVRMARVTGEAFFDYMAGCAQYARQFVVGDFPGAERTCAGLLEMGDSFGTDDTEGSSAVQTFMIRRETGATEQVRPLITGDESPTGNWAPGLLALYVELRLDEPAARLLRWLLDGRSDRYRDSAQWPCVLAFLTEAALRLHDVPALRELRPLLAEYAGLNLVAGQFVAVFGSADRYLGAVDSVLGRRGALDELEAALAMDTRMGATVHRAHSLAALATHHRRAGGDVRTLAELTEEARSLAGPLGLRRVLGVVGHGAAAPAQAAHRDEAPAGLTTRETEIVRLLAAGLLNREISDRLVISENTVANHVRSILAKTGAGNRTQAAMYAAAHGLLEGPGSHRPQ